MNNPSKGYLYFALGALLLLIALPSILNSILFLIALFFIVSGSQLIIKNMNMKM